MKSPFWDWFVCHWQWFFWPLFVGNIVVTFLTPPDVLLPVFIIGGVELLILIANIVVRPWHYSSRVKTPWWDANWHLQPKMTWRRMRAIQKWEKQEKARANEFFAVLWQTGKEKKK